MKASGPTAPWAQSVPGLGAGEIHVVTASLDASASSVARCAGVLSLDERARADRFHRERDRVGFTLARGTLRLLLGRYLDADPASLRFHYGPRGRPALLAPSAPGLDFSVSHSGGLALYAVVSGTTVGVDVERLRTLPEVDRLAERVLSPRERAVFGRLPADGKIEAFFRAWTQKEAYLKATGDGLARPLCRIEVSLAPGASGALLRVERDAGEAGRWSLRNLVPAPGHVAALAVLGRGWRLRCFHAPTDH